MGARPFWYFVPYDPNTGRAFEQLRANELRPPPDADGAAKLWSGDAPRAMLRAFRFGETLGFALVAPLPSDVLAEVYGTQTPDHATVVTKLVELFECLDRGRCAYIIIYQNGAPSELLFAGYSFD
jgi:hypothetical protein